MKCINLNNLIGDVSYKDISCQFFSRNNWFERRYLLLNFLIYIYDKPGQKTSAIISWKEVYSVFFSSVDNFIHAVN